MENNFLWQEKLNLFEDVYCSAETIAEINEWRKSNKNPKLFRPSKVYKKSFELSAPNLDNPDASGNSYWHLNGRNLLGIKRKWMEGNDGKTKNGITLNSGEITIDHSGLSDNFLSNIFIEVHSKEELLNVVKELLSLSNEEIVKKFNITGSKSDIANLFNAIVLDPIIDYEISRNNFKRYGHCWADSQAISLCTNDKTDAYTISSVSSSGIYDPSGRGNQMELSFPNGESITFRQDFVEDKGLYSNEYNLDDISTEILNVKGDSKLLQTVIAQLERFSIKEVKKEEPDRNKNAENKNNTERENHLAELRTKKETLESELAKVNEQIQAIIKEPQQK